MPKKIKEVVVEEPVVVEKEVKKKRVLSEAQLQALQRGREARLAKLQEAKQ